jgi:hypothetical protein
MARNAATGAASATVSTGNRRAYAFAPRRFAGAPLERASFSSIAFVTKSITDVLTFTQCNFQLAVQRLRNTCRNLHPTLRRRSFKGLSEYPYVSYSIAAEVTP